MAAPDVAQNALVGCETRGEFDLPKEPALAISQGARLLRDNANRRLITAATGNFQVGIATAAASASDASVSVMLARVPASGA